MFGLLFWMGCKPNIYISPSQAFKDVEVEVHCDFSHFSLRRFFLQPLWCILSFSFLFLRWGFPSPSIYVFLFVFIVKEASKRLCISILVEMDEGSSLGFYLIYEGFSALYTVSPCCHFLGLLLIWLYYCSSWGGANWIGTSKELCTLPHACPHPQDQFYIPYSYYAQFSSI